MQVLLKYTEYNEPHESLTNKNIIDVSIVILKIKEGHNECLYMYIKALSKKDKLGGPNSPNGEDSDGEVDFTLTPRYFFLI